MSEHLNEILSDDDALSTGYIEMKDYSMQSDIELWAAFKIHFKNNQMDEISRYIHLIQINDVNRVAKIGLRLNHFGLIDFLSKQGLLIELCFSSDSYCKQIYQQIKKPETRDFVLSHLLNTEALLGFLMYYLTHGHDEFAIKNILKYFSQLDEHDLVEKIIECSRWDVFEILKDRINYQKYIEIIAPQACLDRKIEILNFFLPYMDYKILEKSLANCIPSDFLEGAKILLPFINLRPGMNTEKHPLILACKHGANQIFDYVAQSLQFREDFDEYEPYNRLMYDVLILACKKGHLNIVKKSPHHLLDKDHLCCAIENHHDDLIDFLLNIIGSDITALKILITATWHNNLKIVEHILKHDLNIATDLVKSAEIACEKGHFEILKCLLHYPFNFPLHRLLLISCQNNQKIIFDYLTDLMEYPNEQLKETWIQSVIAEQYDMAEKIKPCLSISYEEWINLFSTIMARHSKIDYLLDQYSFDPRFLLDQIVKNWAWHDKFKHNANKIIPFIPVDFSNSFALRTALSLQLNDYVDCFFNKTDCHLAQCEILFWLVNSTQEIETIIKYLPLFNLKKCGIYALRVLKDRMDQANEEKREKLKRNFVHPIFNLILSSVDLHENSFEFLLLAISCEQMEWVNTLIPFADVKAEHSLALRSAIEIQNEDLVKILIPHSNTGDLQGLALKTVLKQSWCSPETVALLMHEVDLSTCQAHHSEPFYQKALSIFNKLQLDQKTNQVHGLQDGIRRL